MIVIADTSGLLAAVDANETEHRACRAAIAQASLLVIPPFVLAELDYLIAKHLGEATAIATCADITESVRRGDYEIASMTPDVLADATAVRCRYRPLALGLTDAVNVVLADRYRTEVLLTLDRRHFRAIRPITAAEPAFRLLPDDGDRTSPSA